jgi:hypothetical protein
MVKRLAAQQTETGDPEIDPGALGQLAKQAGVGLSSLAGKSGSDGDKAVNAMGSGLSGAGTGAGIGASIGSVIPGVGTVIGGAVGAIGGAIAGVVSSLTGGGPRQLKPRERDMLMQGMRIQKTRHLPGAFQTAVLAVYHPDAYRRLRAQRRLPIQIETRLLQKRAYAARAARIERLYGNRIRHEIAHLPPDFRTLVGAATVTGHSRDVYVALQRALRQRGALLNKPSAPPPAPPPEAAPPAAVVPSPRPGPQDEQDAPQARWMPVEPDDSESEAGDPQTSIVMRSVVDVLEAGDYDYAWRPIRVTCPRGKNAEWLLGTFWVFVDALKDHVTGLRWPCSAAETQMVADHDHMRTSPKHLPDWWGPLDREELPCLMMTTRLMCARWLHARQTGEVIPPHPDSTTDLLLASSTRMNRAIEADLERFRMPEPWGPWVADPGKIWALHRRLFDGTSKGAVNYGWHLDRGVPFSGHVSPNSAIPGVSLVQDAGGKHSPYHIDYSQLLLLVAPWCMVAGPGQDAMVPMRTADVYRSRELAGLVTDDAQPLPSVRQPFNAAIAATERRTFWSEQQRIYEGKLRRGIEVLAPRVIDPRPWSHETGFPEVAGAARRAPRRALVVPRSHDPFASLACARRHP